MQIRPLPLLIVGALTTALISGHQQQTISEAKATIAAGEALLMASNTSTITTSNRQMAAVSAYRADLPATDPAYTTDMDVSWHPWHPEGKAAGVIPVALLDAAKDGGISPIYASAVFIHETGWGGSSAWLEKNNPAGIKCGDTYCAYDTAAEGIQRMIAIMADYYSNGRQTVAQQRSMWAEADDAQAIVDLMNQIGKGEN